MYDKPAVLLRVLELVKEKNGKGHELEEAISHNSAKTDALSLATMTFNRLTPKYMNFQNAW